MLSSVTCMLHNLSAKEIKCQLLRFIGNYIDCTGVRNSGFGVRYRTYG